jgi:hypothetical protein
VMRQLCRLYSGASSEGMSMQTCSHLHLAPSSSFMRQSTLVTFECPR